MGGYNMEVNRTYKIFKDNRGKWFICYKSTNFVNQNSCFLKNKEFNLRSKRGRILWTWVFPKIKGNYFGYKTKKDAKIALLLHLI
jgi:hypothetical protein